MKSWTKKKKLMIVVGILIGIGTGMIMWEYTHKPDIENVVTHNLALSNYSQKISLSLNFPDSSTKTNDVLLKTLSNSVVIMEEYREGDNSKQQYLLSSQGKEFNFSRSVVNGVLNVKSPFYERWITIQNPEVLGLNQSIPVQNTEILIDSLKKLTPNKIDVERDKWGKIQSTTLQSSEVLPKETVSEIFTTFAAFHSLKEANQEEQLIWNKLNEGSKNAPLIDQTTLEDILSQTQVFSSDTTLKFDKDYNLSDVESRWECEYKGIQFTLYLNLNAWDFGQTKVEAVSLDSENLVLFNDLTPIDTNKGNSGGEVIEETNTLKDIGDFVTILPQPPKTDPNATKNNP